MITLKEATITSKGRTEEQERQAERMMEDLIRSSVKLALKKVGPDKNGLQRLLGQGPEIGSDLNDFMIAQFEKHSVINQYASEEVATSYTYPPEYKGAKPIKEQIMAIAKIFDLDPTSALEYSKNLPDLPENAENWFAIPSLGAIAKKHFPKITDPAEQYCRAVQFVHAKIKKARKLYNYRDGQIVPSRLRLHARTANALKQIAQVQKGDILIIAAQLAMRHRGRSVRRALEVFSVNEYGLGSLSFGAIMLTHPERIVRWEQLHADMAGDEFSGNGGRFDQCPFVDFRGDGVGFGAGGVDRPNGYFGSASGFLPQ